MQSVQSLRASGQKIASPLGDAISDDLFPEQSRGTYIVHMTSLICDIEDIVGQIF